MKSLRIHDLSRTAELDHVAMAAVYGGTSYGCAPKTPVYCPPSSYSAPSLNLTKNDFSFDASQSLCQDQNTIVNNGNNVAFADCISANVQPCQTGHNTINFG